MTASVGTVEMDVVFNQSKISQSLGQQVSAAVAPAASQLQRSLDQRLGSAGKRAEEFGKSFSTHVSLPLAGVGAIAVKGFTDYDRTLSRISGLNGVAADELKTLSAGAKQVGVDFGVGAQDAVEALYFITSSGFSGSAALDVLKESAKGSAIGLGDTATVADLTTSALNAYKDSGLTAAQVTDQLTAAVRQGKAEPDELAGSLGRVLPVASNLGVSFSEVAGATAAMSLTGSDAAEATTQLRGILSAIVKPSKQAEEALNSVGLSSSGLRQQIKEQGLLPTLQTLTDHLGNNAEATALVFDDVRALTGIMSILGQNTDRTRGIIDDVTQSTGLSGEAMAKVADSDAFKLNKELERTKSGLIEAGAALAPFATAAGSVLGTAADGFAALPGPIQSTVAGATALAVVAGPAAYGIGKMAQGVGKVVEFGGKLLDTSNAVKTIGQTSETAAASTNRAAGGLGKIATAGAAAGIAVTGLATAWSIWNSKLQETADAAKGTGDEIFDRSLNDDLAGAEARLGRINEQIGSLNQEIDDGSGFLGAKNPLDADYLAGLSQLGVELQTSGEKTRNLINQSKELAPQLGKNADEVFKWLAAQAKAGTTYATTDEALKAFNESSKGAADATSGLGAAAGAASANITGLQQQFLDLTGAQASYKDAQESAVQAQRDEERAIQNVTDANRRYQDSLRAVTDAQRAVTDAQNELNSALAGDEGDAIGVERAQIALKRAEERLRKGGFESPLDRQEAELAVREARLRLQDAEAAGAERIEQAKDNLTSAEDRLKQAQDSVLSNQKALSDAVTGQQDAHAKLQKANQDTAGAVFDLDQKQAAFNESLLKGSANVDPFIAHLEGLKAAYPEAAAGLQVYIDKFKELQKLAPKTREQQTLESHNASSGYAENYFPEGRASGGPTAPWSTYQVNERGIPEMWEDGSGRQYMTTAGRAGKVVPIEPVGSAGSGGGLKIEHLEIHAIPQPEETASAVARRLRTVSAFSGVG